jgi:hypothetical protein
MNAILMLNCGIETPETGLVRSRLTRAGPVFDRTFLKNL